MAEVEKWLARVLLLNSGLALAVSLGLLGPHLDQAGAAVVFGAATLGFLAAVASLKRWKSGLWGGVLYYVLQVFSYFPADGREYIVKAGVSIGLIFHFSQGLLVINLIALALLAVSSAVLAWRNRVA
jgi:hypothetical protein